MSLQLIKVELPDEISSGNIKTIVKSLKSDGVRCQLDNKVLNFIFDDNKDSAENIFASAVLYTTLILTI